MKFYTKLLAVILAVMMMATFMVSCFEEDDIKEPSDANGDTIDDEDDKDEDDETDENDETDGEGKDTENETEETPDPVELTIEEAEIYNENGVSVVVKKIEEDWGDYKISVTVSNDSDQNVVVSANYIIVNGFALNASSMYIEVAAGKKANDYIYISGSELKECGITTIANIDLVLRAYDSDTWEDIDISDLISIPTSYVGYVQEVDLSGIEVYNNNGVKIICKGLRTGDWSEGEIVFLIENTTKKELNIYSDDESINGYMVDASMYIDSYPGTYTYDVLYIDNLEDVGAEVIDDIENFDFILEILEADTWDTIDHTDPITLTFE